MPRARFSIVVLSAMTACAAGMFAPEMPAKIRERKSTESDPASPNTRYDTNDPNRLIRMTGRRPIRSDSRPQMGAKTSCISENDVESSPIIRPVAPKVSA